jgi:hypothetical protein
MSAFSVLTPKPQCNLPRLPMRCVSPAKLTPCFVDSSRGNGLILDRLNQARVVIPDPSLIYTLRDWP